MCYWPMLPTTLLSGTFIDDIFCASENVHQHLLHLELLFHSLMENNLTINLEKSHFFRSKIKLLWHILTSTGIKPDPEKIPAIQNFSRPRNLKELREFLGLVNFYTKFSKKPCGENSSTFGIIKKRSKMVMGWRPGKSFQGDETFI